MSKRAMQCRGLQCLGQKAAYEQLISHSNRYCWMGKQPTSDFSIYIREQGWPCNFCKQICQWTCITTHVKALSRGTTCLLWRSMQICWLNPSTITCGLFIVFSMAWMKFHCDQQTLFLHDMSRQCYSISTCRKLAMTWGWTSTAISLQHAWM